MAADSDSDEDLVCFGTPLEPLEEDEPLRKPVPLHEQTVKDEKGRYQRFHGAFTGGFSAGYFNTVGSKEGWAPSTFLSSRQQKAEKHHARPEDFMDEEDFSEHGIAPREITTSQEFWSGRRDQVLEKSRAIIAQTSLIPGDTLLEDLITPARSSVGVELLRKMGWKEGQGVGPRVKRRARRQETEGAVRVYGCALPPAGSEDSEDEDDEFAPEDVTFAPKDVTPVDFTPRTGVQGLGYRGLDPGLALLGHGAAEHIDLFRPQSNTRSSLFGDAGRSARRGGVAGQGFGVGALEDDDEDIYQRDSMSRYDSVLGGEEPGDGLYGWTAPQQYTKKTDGSRDAAYIGKILDGFTLARKPAQEKTIFPPPVLPRDYRPVHRFCPVVDVSRLSGVSPALAEALKASRGHMVKEEPQQGRHQLDSGQRRALLGESTLQGPSSVMELLKPEDRQRLLNLRGSSVAPPSMAPPSMAPPSSAPPSMAPPSSAPPSMAPPSSAPPSSSLQQQEALAAWRGVPSSSQTFRPFEKTPSKQARYEVYLSRLQQGDKDALDRSLDPTMTEWERSREREEFVRASILYRPSSSSLSSRFTRAKLQEDEDAVEVNRDQEGDVDDKQSAVSMKMFGKMTRETFEWHPDKLLCKRFNVPDPYPGSGLVGLPKVKRDKFSVFNFLTMTDSKGTAGSSEPPRPPESGKKSRWDVSEPTGEKAKSEDPLSQLPSTARNRAETKQDQTPAPAFPRPPEASSSTPAEEKSSEQSSETKTEPDEDEESRPPMDLFRAVFGSSSDEKSSSSSEEDEEDEDKEDNNMELQPVKLFNIHPSPPSSTSEVKRSQPTAAATSSQTSVQDEEEFGPRLPPPAGDRGGAVSSSLPAEEEKPNKRTKEKKVKKNRKHYKHKKEKKKKKAKKHKHKDKQQKKSKEESDGEGSGEEDREVTTDDLLNRLKTIRSLQNR